MGIACLCAYDLLAERAHVFMRDNLPDFIRLIDGRRVMGWNNHRFDDPLCAANGIAIAPDNSLDLFALVARAAGIPDGERPSGLGLDAVCRANGIPGKTGDGASAPLLYQTGQYGKLIDYCLGDVHATLRLYRLIAKDGGCVDPRNGQWLSIEIPGFHGEPEKHPETETALPAIAFYPAGRLGEAIEEEGRPA